MKKMLPLILTIGIVPLIILGISLLLNYINKNGPNITDNIEVISTSIIPEIFNNNSEDDVPLLNDESLIRDFFTLINTKRIPEAIAMMGSNILGDEPVQANSTMQEFGVTFNSWKSVTVSSVKSIDKNSWPADEHTYMVDLEIQFQPNAPSQIWSEGTNTRFITLVKEGDTWKIGSLATGF